MAVARKTQKFVVISQHKDDRLINVSGPFSKLETAENAAVAFSGQSGMAYAQVWSAQELRERLTHQAFNADYALQTAMLKAKRLLNVVDDA